MGRPKKLKEGEVELNYVDVKTVAEAPEVPSQDLKERDDFEVVDNALDREGNPSETPVRKLKQPAQEGIGDVKAWAGVADNDKTFDEVAASNSESLEQIKAWSSDENPADKYPNEEEPESVHILGHNVISSVTLNGERKSDFLGSEPNQMSLEAIKDGLGITERASDEELARREAQQSKILDVFPPDEEPIPDVEDEGVDVDDIIDQLVQPKTVSFQLEEDLVVGGDALATVGNPRAGQTAKNAAVRNVFTPKADGEATNAPRISSPATGIHRKPATVKSVEGNRSGMFIINKDRPIKN